MADASRSSETSFLHDAFISYSRKDAAFVAVLEAALRSYKPPRDLLAPQRRLNIFRDTEDFTGTEYFASIEKHLQSSRKLIVICSPNARQSPYVDDETRRFAQTHVASDIVPVLIAGIPNNEAKSDDDEEAAFPKALIECLDMPMACDYRGLDPKSDKPASGKRFQPEWFKLLANIYGCTRAEIEQRERRRQREQRIRWTAAGVTVASLLGLALGAAEFQRRTAKSEELAAQSMQQSDKDPDQAFKLARAAVEQRETKLSTSALRLALAKAPDLLIPFTRRPPVSDEDYVEAPKFDFALDGRRFAIAEQEPRIVDLETGRTILKIAGEGKQIAGVRFSPDGAWLAVIDENHNTIVFDMAYGRAVTKVDGELHWRASPTVGAQQAVVLFDKTVQIGELNQSGNWHSSRKLTPRDYSRPTRDEEDLTASHKLSPGGRKLASLVTRNDIAQLTVTDLDTGKPISRTLGSPKGLRKVVWSPKGSYLVAVSLSGLHVVETRLLKSVFQRDSGNVITVEDATFSPNEKFLATTDRGGKTFVWDIAKSKKIAEMFGPPERAYDPIFTSSGELLSVRYGTTNRVYLFAVDEAIRASDSELSTEPLAIFEPIWGGVKTKEFTHDGSALVVEYEKNKLAIWKTERWRWRHRLPIKYDARYEAGIPEGLRDIRVTADGAAVGVLHGGRWRGWSAVAGDEVSYNGDALKPLDKVTLAEFANLKLRADKNDETTVYLEDRSDGSLVYSLGHNAQVMSKTFSANGNCILTTSRFMAAGGEPPASADVARLWDTETGALLREWHFGFGAPDGAIFTGTDRIVVLSEGEGFVYTTPLCGSLDALRQQARKRIPNP